MGTLYVYQDLAPTVNVHGGNAGSNGTGGSRGKTASQHPGSNVYMASGGGGGGAGGFGGAASNIGTGGPGGGGGGGGAAGNVAWVVYSGTLNGYYHAGAFGGDGGKNADGSTRTSKELASEVVPATIRMMLAGRMGTVVIPAARAAQQVLPASAAPTAP